MKKTFTLLTCIAWIGLATHAYSQGITTAAINGKITSKATAATSETPSKDKGENLAGVVVLAVHIPSGTQYSVATNAAGRYNIPGMRIGGPYKITVNLLGFKAQPQENIYLELGDNYEVDFTMVEESTQLDEVVVKGAADNLMNSDRTGAGTNIKKEQFERLPSLNRSIQDFTALTPQAGNNFSFGGRSQLYNNFAIDGATSGNLFGLSALPGGQSGAQPISLDALQEVKVTVAPYDVRQGNFTGVAVNAVTRSGTNEFSGSVYGFGRNYGMTGSKIAGQQQTATDYSYYNTGFRLGGPIIKNKMFFFVNYEQEERKEAAIVYKPYTPGATGNDVSNVPYDSLQMVSDFLKSKGYNTGPFTGFNRIATHSDKGIIKLDFNISKIHKLSIKYNFLFAYQDVNPSGRANTASFIPYESSYYRIHNQTHSVFAELNSTFNSKYSNSFQVGYSAFRDYRTSLSDDLNGGNGFFPQIDIWNKNTASNATTLGYEQFTYGNRLNQDVFQISNNFNMYKREHVFTFGASAEYINIYNYFVPQRSSYYQYQGGYRQFLNDASGIAGNSPNSFILQYPAQANGDPSYKFNAATLGFYAQDEYTGIKNLKVIAGIRVDVPIFLTTLQKNTFVDSLTFNNGEKIHLDKLPNTTPLFSPRVGFNWDVTGDKKTQIRGGTGLFTGRIPYVWVGNQAGNNGLLINNITNNGAAATNNHFSMDPNAYISSNTVKTYAINSVVPDFKFPQVWRTNIAVDRKLLWNTIGTLEFIYTKDINAVYYRNANMVDPNAGTIEGDGRPYYPITPQLKNINQSITQALVLDNTNKGYSWSITAQLQKTFANGFYASAAYTYTDARDISSAAGNSTANTFWSSNAFVGNMNNPTSSYSSSLTPHRFIFNTSYRKEYLKHFATTFSLVYDVKNLAVINGVQQSVFSYTYGGDPVFSGGNSYGNNQSLIYIPKNKDDIILVPTSNTDTRTPDQIWNQLDAYINQDSYLSAHRGEYAARNGVVAPLYHRVDLRILQDIYTTIGKVVSVDESGYAYKGKRNSFQISLEVINVLNLLNSNWGLIQTPNRPGATAQLLNFVGYENPGITNASGQVIQQPSGRPEFTFPTTSDPNNASQQIPLSTTYRNDVGLNSRYQIQVGLRYTFN